MADQDTDTSKTGGISWIWWALGVLALVLVVMWIFQAASNPTPTATNTTEGTTQAGVPNTGAVATSSATPSESTTTQGGRVTVSAIKQSPTTYDGANVTVTGEVAKTYGTRILVLTESGAVGGQGGVIVVSPTAISAAAGDKVVVEGTVRAGIVKNVLGQLGIAMPAGAEALAGERGIIVATVIKKPDTQQGTTEPTPAPPPPSSSTQPPPPPSSTQ